MKKILLPVSFIFLMGLFPEQLFARELTRAEIDRSSFYDTSSIAKVILIENDSERQRMLIEIKFHLSLNKYYTAGIVGQYSPVDGEYFVVYRYNRGILIAIGSSTLEIKLYKSRENISGISEIVENTYDKLVESIEMFEFINGVNTSLVPPPGPIYEIDPSDIIPEISGEYILVPTPERPSERQFDERTQLEYEIVDGRSVTITRYRYNENATTLNIPAQIQGLPVTVVGNAAFCDSHDLTSITIPSSVTFIGNGAFSGKGEYQGCISLTSITVDNRNPSYASIDGVLFDKNIRTLIIYPQGRNQSTYVIPSSVTSIGGWAFRSNSLTSITIPSSVMSIGDGAFSSCSRLTSITIPSSVTSIGDYAFHAYGLTSITVDNRNPSYASIDGVLFDKGIRTIIKYPIGKTARTYTIPSSVTSIGDWAFSYCSSLTSVTIPSSVTSIGRCAFDGCESLTNVTIPSSVTSIGQSAFSGCSGLISIAIPSSVTSIGDSAFSWCESLTSVTLSRRTRVGEDAFPETVRIIYRD